jgi:hypothetical protein
VPTSSDKLSRCKQLFDSWRKQASTNRGKRIIPRSLWKEAVSLIGAEFTISRIASELGLNLARLREKQIELNASSSKNKREKNETQFIQLKTSIPFPAKTYSSDLQISITRSDGTRLSLCLNSSHNDMVQNLVTAFIRS